MKRRRSSSKEDRLAGVINVITTALTGLGVPKYSSERSNRIYSVHAKMGMLIIKQYMKLTFRSLCSLLASTPRALKAAGTKYIPDHSTLVKFSASVDPSLLDKILNSVAMMLCNDEITMAMDATGFSCSKASRHFEKRMKQMGAQVASVRNYTKASIAVDTSTLAVLACETSMSDVHDVKHVPKILDKVAAGGYDVRHVVADRGYDSENVHERISERLNAEPVIPARDMTGRHGDKGKMRGKNRKRMVSAFPAEIYRCRCLIETVNSMIKRKMGDTVLGHSDESRHKEVVCRCISHNLIRVFETGAT